MFVSDPPVEIRLVLVNVDVIDGVQAQPGVEGKAILVWPLCNGRKSNGLVIHKHRLLLYVLSLHCKIFTNNNVQVILKVQFVTITHVETYMC